MFVTDFHNRQYALSNGYDIDTATTDMAKKSFDLNVKQVIQSDLLEEQD